ncbi:MAG: MBL fold metallo-hydrolase [Myxococcales bacterium]|nr:MBL fold metallo-hydrolase [Myxococcales bacterium]
MPGPIPTVEAFYDAPTYTLTFLVYDPQSADAVIIDPVLDYDPLASQTGVESAQALLERVRELDLKVHLILETHAHADHLSASQWLRDQLGAAVAIGERITMVQQTFKGLLDLPDDFATDGSQFDRLLADGEVVDAGTLRVGVIATPGHTPACDTYHIGDALFTGDALFMHDYGTGRCDFPRGSSSALYDSVQRLYALPDDTRVFVGHDYQPDGREPQWETTIGLSKAQNPQLRADTTREQFVTLRDQRDATLAPPRLIFQSVQVNIDGGRLPPAHANGVRYLRLPLNLFRPSDDLGAPRPKGEVS